MCRKGFIFPFSILLSVAFSSCREGGQASQTGAPEAVDLRAGTGAVARELSDTVPLVESSFTTAYIMGKFDPERHPDFTRVDERYADGPGYLLRKDAYEAFRKMFEAAAADGVQLRIISATRNFEWQKGIWEAKWTGKRGGTGAKNYLSAFPDPYKRAKAILLTSSMPGTSRHHWGTDVDLNATDNDFFSGGEGLKAYRWLLEHAADYGFCQPYNEKGPDRPNGYEEERWHWSFMPVARRLTRLAGERLANDMIGGFEGAETAKQIDVVNHYVLGVNPICK